MWPSKLLRLQAAERASHAWLRDEQQVPRLALAAGCARATRAAAGGGGGNGDWRRRLHFTNPTTLAQCITQLTSTRTMVSGGVGEGGGKAVVSGPFLHLPYACHSPLAVQLTTLQAQVASVDTQVDALAGTNVNFPNADDFLQQLLTKQKTLQSQLQQSLGQLVQMPNVTTAFGALMTALRSKLGQALGQTQPVTLPILQSSVDTLRQRLTSIGGQLQLALGQPVVLQNVTNGAQQLVQRLSGLEGLLEQALGKQLQLSNVSTAFTELMTGLQGKLGQALGQSVQLGNVSSSAQQLLQRMLGLQGQLEQALGVPVLLPNVVTVQQQLLGQLTGMQDLLEAAFGEAVPITGMEGLLEDWLASLADEVGAALGKTVGLAGFEGAVGDLAQLAGSQGTALDAANQQISGLKGQVAGLEGQVSGLQGQVTSLKQNVTALQGQVGDLQGQVSSLQGQVSCCYESSLLEVGVCVCSLLWTTDGTHARLFAARLLHQLLGVHGISLPVTMLEQPERLMLWRPSAPSVSPLPAILSPCNPSLCAWPQSVKPLLNCVTFGYYLCQ